MRHLSLLGRVGIFIALMVAMLIYIQFNWVGLVWISGPSMEPTLHSGDARIIWRTTEKAKLERGCIAVFRRDKNNVKRVLGMPGDTVQIIDGHIHANQVLVDTFLVIHENQMGSAILMMEANRVYHESWNATEWGPFVVPYLGMALPLDSPQARQYHTLILREWNTLHPESTVTEVQQIPDLGRIYVFREDHYFLVGDNRNASLDSRGYGPLPHSACRGVIARK